tara:strand:+ start:720 stop:1295 length:576 start_codon:yes stop_codon:yes gene_type:complete
MGAAAYTHLITKTASTYVGNFYFENIPQTYRTIMGIVTGQCTTSSSGGENNMDICINPAGGNTSGYTSPDFGWNKGFQVAGTSGQTVYNGYNSSSSFVGLFYNSFWFTHCDDVQNTCIFHLHDYANANTITTISWQAGSNYRGTSDSASAMPGFALSCGGTNQVGATTSLTVGPSGSFQSGARISLYGMAS